MTGKLKPYEHKAHYYETDQMGVVHHSNYIRWFEESRVDWMEQLGFSYKKLEEMGVMIPVLSVSCEYRNSIRFDETVYVLPEIKEFNGFKLTVSYKVIRKNDGMQMASGETRHCFTKKDFSPCRTKRDYPEIYKIFSDSLGADLYEFN